MPLCSISQQSDPSIGGWHPFSWTSGWTYPAAWAPQEAAMRRFLPAGASVIFPCRNTTRGGCAGALGQPAAGDSDGHGLARRARAGGAARRRRAAGCAHWWLCSAPRRPHLTPRCCRRAPGSILHTVLLQVRPGAHSSYQWCSASGKCPCSFCAALAANPKHGCRLWLSALVVGGPR